MAGRTVRGRERPGADRLAHPEHRPHFGAVGHPRDTVTFPPTDIAALARGFGFESVTVRTLTDLEPVEDWLTGPLSAPLLIDAKATRDHGSWWLEEAFGGH